MNGHRLAAAVRASRIRRQWRQQDLADQCGVSQSTVSRLERGHVDTLTLATLESVTGALEIRLELVPRWRGGDLDRLVNAGHAALHEAIARWFQRRWREWRLAPEVSFAVYGERGVIDVLAWHEATRTLLVIELKTALVDLSELVGTLDRKRRLAANVARERGWQAVTVGAWVVVASSRTNRRHVADHERFLRNAFPAGSAAMRAWLRHPAGPIAALSVETLGARVGSPRRRVRRSGSGARRRAA